MEAQKKILGEDLRLAREQKKISLRQACDDTHISLRHLENIEAGRYADLPGGMYNRAFLRTYCTYLGLAPDSFLERYEREINSLSERVTKAKPRVQQEMAPSREIPPVLIWTVMLLISIAGLYFSRGWISEVFSPYFSQPPASRLPNPQANPAPAVPNPAPSQAADKAGPPATTGQEQVAKGEELQKAAADAAAPVTTEPPPGTMRLEFQGISACWMSVASDGKPVFSGTVRPGETPYFDAKEKFELILGNAGGVGLKINGKPARPLGKPGEVVRISIDPQSIADLLEKKIT